MTTTTAPVPAGYTAGEVGFNKYIGPIWRAPDGSEFLFDIRDEHLNGGGAIHGGMMMALADIVIGRTVRESLGGAGALTISLNCDFIGPAKLGERVRGTAAITRKTRSIVFAGCELAVEGRTIMTATGIWKILGPE